MQIGQAAELRRFVSRAYRQKERDAPLLPNFLEHSFFARALHFLSRDLPALMTTIAPHPKALPPCAKCHATPKQ